MRPIITSFLLLLFSVARVHGQQSKTIDSLLKLAGGLDDAGKAPIFLNVGNNFYLEGMNDSALYYYAQSLDHATRVNNTEAICEAYIAMAKCNLHLQRQDEAIDILFKCIAIAEKKKLGKYTSNAKYLVSIIYNYQGKPKEALQFAYDSEQISVQMKDTIGLISLYPALIACLGKNADTAKAISYFRTCLNLFDGYETSTTLSAEDRDHLPLKKMALIFNSANIMRKDEDLQLALNEVQELGDRILAGNNDYEKFEYYTLLAIINLRLKNYRACQQNGEKATSFIRAESGNYEQLGDVYDLISQASVGLGEYEKAYNAFTRYKNYNDSIYKTSTLEAIHSVEAKYETAKKEEKIRVLNVEKRRQRVLVIVAIAGLLVVLVLLFVVSRAKRLQKKLFASEKEAQRTELEMKMFELEQTALRAQMNPHFIFNCLNSVQRYVSSQDINGANKYLSGFASLIRKTLENSGKQFISLRDELEYLNAYVNMERLRGADHFDFTMQVEEGLDAADIYIPSMMVQPFVENSIQHGLKQVTGRKGILKITVSKDDGVKITVEDNGVGINNDTDKLPVEHVSMGGSITAKRIEIYNSLHPEKIKFEIIDRSLPGEGETGTRVVILFPVYNSSI